MTLEEAIRHCEEMAEENDLAAGTYKILAENNHNAYEKQTAETNSSRCAECASDHRQLAEWLEDYKLLRGEYETCQLNSINDYRREAARCRAAFFKVDSQFHHLGMRLMSVNDELKEAKRLLKSAVEDITFILSYTCSDEEMCCEECPTVNHACNKWRYADEALKLIGGTENGET